MINWIATATALPPKDTLVLVSGLNTQDSTGGHPFTEARLLDEWLNDDGRANVWVNEADFSELHFEPTHWQPVQTLHEH